MTASLHVFPQAAPSVPPSRATRAEPMREFGDVLEREVSRAGDRPAAGDRPDTARSSAARPDPTRRADEARPGDDSDARGRGVEVAEPVERRGHGTSEAGTLRDEEGRPQRAAPRRGDETGQSRADVVTSHALLWRHQRPAGAGTSEVDPADLVASESTVGREGVQLDLVAETEFAGTEFADTVLTDTVLAGTEFAGTEFADTVLADTEFAGTEFAATDFAGTVHAETEFVDTELVETGLKGGTGLAAGMAASDELIPADAPMSAPRVAPGVTVDSVGVTAVPAPVGEEMTPATSSSTAGIGGDTHSHVPDDPLPVQPRAAASPATDVVAGAEAPAARDAAARVAADGPATLPASRPATEAAVEALQTRRPDGAPVLRPDSPSAAVSPAPATTLEQAADTLEGAVRDLVGPAVPRSGPEVVAGTSNGTVAQGDPGLMGASRSEVAVTTSNAIGQPAVGATGATRGSAVVQRLLDVARALENAPPPRSVMVELGDLRGLRIEVRIGASGAVHVAAHGPAEVVAPIAQLGRDLADALSQRGMHLGDFQAGQDGGQSSRGEAANGEGEGDLPGQGQGPGGRGRSPSDQPARNRQRDDHALRL